jgi:acetyl-CoA carboxylase carboxyltransferase component
VQIRGSCLAVTSPRVIEIATGEAIGFEELGGVEVHDKTTGQIDLVADDEAHAVELVRRTLSYLPQNAWEEPARTPWDGHVKRDERLYDIVPMRRQRAYDMRVVLRHLTDDDAIHELKPNFERSLITAFGRMAGRSVGFIASQPMYYAGALSPDSCDKASAFVCLCDAYNIPIVFLQDVPGFMVGKHVEHHNMLGRAIRFFEALALAEVPRLSVVLRKAFGLAYFSLSGSGMGNHALAAWPSAEISFMDPQVGVNVVHGGKLQAADDAGATRQGLIEEWTLDTDPEGAAGTMEVDEVIDPADTRAWLCTHLDRLRVPVPPWGQFKPLASWPTCY